MQEKLFHFAAKVHSKSGGSSAVALGAYRGGVSFRSVVTGKRHTYSRRRDVMLSGLLLPENAPAWMRNRGTALNAMDRAEANILKGQVAREFVLACPWPEGADEGYPLEWISQLIHGFLKQFADAGLLVSYDVHCPPLKKGHKNRNLHSHVLLSMRRIDPSRETGFAKNKARDFNDPDNVTVWRKNWSEHVNAFFRDHGIKAFTDHRSNADRGLDAVPTIHLGRRTDGNAKSWDRKAKFNRLARATRPGTPLPSGYGGSDGDGTGGCSGMGGSGGAAKPMVTPGNGDPVGTGAAYSQVSDTDWKY